MSFRMWAQANVIQCCKLLSNNLILSSKCRPPAAVMWLHWTQTDHFSPHYTYILQLLQLDFYLPKSLFVLPTFLRRSNKQIASSINLGPNFCISREFQACAHLASSKLLMSAQTAVNFRLFTQQQGTHGTQHITSQECQCSVRIPQTFPLQGAVVLY